MTDLAKLKSDKTLIVGTGSGRDIASAILVRERFRENCPHVDFAGFLTPWSLHSFDGVIERPINTTFTYPQKFLPLKEYSPLKGFFEPLMKKYNIDYDLGINKIFLFSLHYGTNALLSEINELIKKEGYDLIIAVDVGGDILARPDDLHTVLTPLVDLTCLHLIADISPSVLSLLAVIAPGVCGEIPPQTLTSIIEEFAQNGLWIEKLVYDEKSIEFKKFMILNDAINRESKSYSHTERMINQIARYKTNSNLKTEYLKKYRIEDQEFVIPFNIEIEKNFFNSIFLFDLKQVSALRVRSKLEYENILEGFLKIRSSGVCGTEVDLSYVPTKLESGRYESAVFLLTPCCYASVDMRREIIRYGCEQIRDNKLKFAILLEKDAILIPENIKLESFKFGQHYCLACKEKIEKNFINYLSKLC